MKAYKMPSESLQTLNSDYSELHSPDSLYTKDLSELLPEEIKLSSTPAADLHRNNTYKLMQDEQISAPGDQASVHDLMEAYTSNHSHLLCSPEVYQDQALEKASSAQSSERATTADHSTEDPSLKVGLLLRDPEDSLSQFPTIPSDIVKGTYELRQPSPLASPDTTVFSDANTLSVLTDHNMHINGETSVLSSGDVNTQMSLCQQSDAMHLGSELLSPTATEPLWVLVNEGKNESNSPLVSPHKARKSSFDADAPSSNVDSTANNNSFDLGCAVSSPQFLFTKFGSEVPGVFTFGGQKAVSQSSGDAGVKSASNAVTSLSRSEAEPMAKVEGNSDLPAPTRPRSKETNLNGTFPSRSGNIELKVIVQPEDQHRARYMTEGSRGAVKDKSQNGHPMIQLKGYDKQAKIKIFIGSDSGRIKPHGFYQACRVCGKNSTPCSERDVGGTTVIEVLADPKEDMQVRVDCVGILKLRNADVEQRIGVQRSKKKSTRVRMVFRVDITKPDGSTMTLQTSSTPISCTQPAGQPEVCRKSLSKCSVKGGEDLFIIGKNFTKGSKVLLQQKGSDEQVTWSAEAPVELEFFQPTHLICRLPAYKDVNICEEVKVNLLVQCNDRISEASEFTYTPECPVIKSEEPIENINKVMPMETDSQTPPFSVSPIAVALNKLYEKCNGSSNGTTVLPTILIQSIQPAAPVPISISNNLSSNHGNCLPVATTTGLTLLTQQSNQVANQTIQTLQQQAAPKPITVTTNTPMMGQQAINMSTTESVSNVSQILLNSLTQPTKSNNEGNIFSTLANQPSQSGILVKENSSVIREAVNSLSQQLSQNGNLVNGTSVSNGQIHQVNPHAQPSQQNSLSLSKAFAVSTVNQDKMQNEITMREPQQVLNNQLNSAFSPQINQNSTLGTGMLTLQQSNAVFCKQTSANMGVNQQSSQKVVLGQQSSQNIVFDQQMSTDMSLSQKHSNNVDLGQISQNVAFNQQLSPNLGQQNSQNVVLCQQTTQNVSVDQQMTQNMGLGQHTSQNVVLSHQTPQNVVLEQQMTQNMGLGQHTSQNMGLGQQTSQNVVLEQQMTQNMGFDQQTSQNVVLEQQMTQNMGFDQQTSQNMGLGQQTSQNVLEQQMTQNMGFDQQTSQTMVLGQQTTQNVVLGQSNSQNVVLPQQASQNVIFGQAATENMALGHQGSQNLTFSQQNNQTVGICQQAAQNVTGDQQTSQSQNLVNGHGGLQDMLCGQQTLQNVVMGQQTLQNVFDQHVSENLNSANQSPPVQSSANSVQILNVNDGTTSQVVDERCFQSTLPRLDGGYQDPVIRGSQSQSPSMLMNMKAGASLADGQKSSMCPPPSLVKEADLVTGSCTADWQTRQHVPRGSESGKAFPSLSLQDVLGVLGTNATK